MATPDNFYVEQAASCAKSASETTLPNLREKFLRSQAAWQFLADRETATKAARDKRDAEKAAAGLPVAADSADFDTSDFDGFDRTEARDCN